MLLLLGCGGSAFSKVSGRFWTAFRSSLEAGLDLLGGCCSRRGIAKISCGSDKQTFVCMRVNVHHLCFTFCTWATKEECFTKSSASASPCPWIDVTFPTTLCLYAFLFSTMMLCKLPESFALQSLLLKIGLQAQIWYTIEMHKYMPHRSDYGRAHSFNRVQWRT